MNRIFTCKAAFARRLLKSGRVVASLIALLITLAMLVATSVAWFSANRKVDSNDMGGALAVDDTTAIYKAYMFDLENMVGVNRIMGENGEYEELNIANLNMNQYDTIFSVQNKYTPAFAQIQITRNKSMPASGTVLITIDRDTAIAPFDNDGKLAERISSILRFTAIIDSTKNDLTMTDANTLYDHINSDTRFNEIKKYEGALDSSKTFISVHGAGAGHTHEKADTITVSLPYTEGDWYLDEQENQTLNVYLYMSYDVQLIECFIKEHSGDKISLDDTTYEFENDLKKVAVSYTKPSD